MFDNLLTSSPQTWGMLIGGLVALPILIHLINLMRHQKVEWAAMEFLLKSYKKNRNWVWLKQLLLLLSRIAILLLVLFMLAQIGCNNDRIARLLGSETTHHYVLLDDSFSMSDRGSDGAAFDRALSSLSMIASRAKNRQNQKFTLLRYSQATPSSTESGASGEADMNAELVDNLFEQRLEEVKSRLGVSNLAVGVRDALAVVKQLILARENETAIVYVLSDFRLKDWQNAEAADSLFAEIEQTGAATELISCGGGKGMNLTVTDLSAVGNVRVAGTPLMMQVTVKNCSQTSAKKVQVELGTYAFPGLQDEGQSLGDLSPEIEELPTVFIEAIEPGKSETREFPVYFRTTGRHAIRARLKNDSIIKDNTQWAVTEFASSARVLIVDDLNQSQGRFLALAINPGGMTGIAPEFKTAEFLRDATEDQLNSYDAVYLLDPERLDDVAINNLESFTRSGGGVGIFVGPKTNVAFFTNQLYRNGEGIFPIPLEKVVEVPEQTDERVPDISPGEDPLFPPGMKNPLLDLVQVKKIIQPPVEWKLGQPKDVSIAATVRGIENWPLIVRKKFGNGNVVAFMTSAGPIWNNWARNGTFPPVMLLVEDLLASGKYQTVQDLVGVPIDVAADADQFGSDVVFLVPDSSDASMDGGTNEQWSGRVELKRKMELDSDGQAYRSSIGGEAAERSDVGNPGIYDIWLRSANAELQVQRFALNVDASESEMALIERQALLSSFPNSKPTFVSWDQFNPEPQELSASSITKLLLILLLVFLLIEQLLAYSASFHSSKRRSPIPSFRMPQS